VKKKASKPYFVLQLTFVVVSQQSARALAAKWGPKLQRCPQYLGIQLTVTDAKNIPIFAQRLLEGNCDLAYMSPYYYVVYHQESGYKVTALKI